MSAELGLALAGVVLGGLVQSATGFGFALIAAPALAATLGPREAVPTIAVLSLAVNLLTLLGEGRAPAVERHTAAVLTAASVPGMAIGALILATAPEDALRLVVAAVVVGTVIAYVRLRDDGPARSSATGAGFVSGVLATTAGINGPPLVVHLRRIGLGTAQTRDTLAAFFLVSALLTIAAVTVAGALELPNGVLVLLAGAAGGQLAGRLAFRQLEAHREAATLGVLALSAAAAVVPVVQALS